MPEKERGLTRIPARESSTRLCFNAVNDRVHTHAMVLDDTALWFYP